MTNFKKIAAVALTAATLAVSAAPAEARYGRNAALGLGILGGLAVGAMIAGSRPTYAAPVYAAPVYQQCHREHVGYNSWGRPIFQRVCY